ncbi:MAG: Cys-Gln thioester bond-forming surface protein, partial [Clostridia bacterium]|nr:Cys-Gln thioester bond-forming surface protein [Clostridia bacterium]
SGVFAAQIGEIKDIVSLGECGNDLKYTNSEGVTMEVLTHYVVYNENGKQYPAYCLNVNLHGVDDNDSYGVEVGDMSQIANNQAVWRVLLNGFPYKSATEMGLDNDYQAFAVTKQAVYSVLDGRDTNRYFGTTDAGNRMANKIRELANIGRNGTQTYTDPVISATANSQAGVDNKDSKYVSQTFTVNSSVNMKDIQIILNGASAPEGTKITDINNNVKTTFNRGEQFKVLVPRINIREEINIQFSISGQCETYPILFGKAPNANLQNYALTTDPFILSTARGNMQYKPKADVEIEKITNGDSKITGATTGSGLKGAVFTVTSKDGTFTKEVTTDEYGKFLLSGMDLGEYIISEKLAPDYFLKGKNTTFEVNLVYDGDDKKVVIENTPVDIQVSVEKGADKTEAQGKEIVTYEIDKIKNLSNVKLDNFTLTDDLPKEVRIQSLETGIYNEDLKYSITYNTNKKSNIKLQENLSTTVNNKIDFTKINLEEDEYVTSYSLNFGTVKIGFSNTTKMKVATKVIEGLADKSKFVNNVKVSGTYLEAKTEDKDDVPVTVYENILKIKKVTKEYNQYTDLPEGTRINAVFELLDENQKYVDTLRVNDTEEFIYKYLETGKTYYLKEVSTDPYYVINKELQSFKFEKNGQVIDLEIKNDNVNLVVDVEKDAPTEAQKGEVIDYTFSHLGNFSNTKVSNFVWGDKLPRQVRVQELQTGIWNEELEYEIKYITNKNTNWKNIGEKYKTTENHKIDLTSQALGLEEDEYVKEFKLVFDTEVKEGFEATTTPVVKAKVNEDVQNNKIFVNNTYVTASYQKTKLEAKDNAHTVVYTKTPDIDKELPKTGIDN